MSVKYNIGIISTLIPHKSYSGADFLYQFTNSLHEHGHRVSCFYFSEFLDDSLLAMSRDQDHTIKKKIGQKNCFLLNTNNRFAYNSRNKYHAKLNKYVNLIFDIFHKLKLLFRYSKLLKKKVFDTDMDFYIVYPDATKYCLFNFQNKKMVGWISHNGYPFFKIDYLFSKKRLFDYLTYKFTKSFYIFLNIRAVSRFYFSFASPKFWMYEYKKILGKKLINFSHPAKDFKPNLKNVSSELKKNKKIKVLFLGCPTAGLTAANFFFFKKNILPIIIEKKLIHKFEFISVGKFGNYSNLMLDLNKYVTFKGLQKNVSKTIYRSDIVLLANEFKPNAGSKVSDICSNYGCILAHKSLTLSHHEMRENFNCLTAESGEEFLNKMLFIKKENALRMSIKKNARKTFEKFFKTEIMIKKIIRKYESLEKNDFKKS